MTQEFHVSVTPIGEDEYLVRTERVAPGVPLAEEQVTWPVDEWLTQASQLMNDPLLGLLRGDIHSLPATFNQPSRDLPDLQQSSAGLVALGQQLYNALFRGTIRDSWMTAQGIAQHRQEVLRLRLGLKDARLPRLPWEVLHASDRPLATGTDVVFSRYHSSLAALASPFQFQPVLTPDQPLKILMVLAAPSDQEILELKQEALHLQEELQTALNGGRDSRFSDIQLTILEQPGREQLTQALEHNHYQVLHYAGHSNLGTDGGKVYLVSSKTGLTETLSGDDLAGLLVNNGIRMAVFNSCRGVYTATVESADKREGNLAEALLKRGIPAVLAMAERIPDDVALNLSRLFYRNLKQFYPVDLSLNRARQGLISSYSSNQMYWALPILYLHPEFDGYLQPIAQAASSIDRVTTPPVQELPPELAPELEPATATVKELTPHLEAELAEAESELLTHVSLDLSSSDDAALNTASLDHYDLDHYDLDHYDEVDGLDPDDLEFEDPEYIADLEIAQLVNQLSRASTEPADDGLLPASPTERLLPQIEDEFNPEDYLILPENPRYSTPNSVEPNDRALPAKTVSSISSDSIELYLDLERMLAESGKLTESIALCNRAVQNEPDNADAHARLGQSLYQEGYLAEATLAYQQSLQVNPASAEVHNHLGLALYHQGNLAEAIKAYDRAIQLNPEFLDAQRNLEIALQRQERFAELSQSSAREPSYRRMAGQGTAVGEMSRVESRVSMATDSLATSPSGFKSSYAQVQPASAKSRKRFLWAGGGTLGVGALLLGLWFFNDRFVHPALNIPLPESTLSASTYNSDDLRRVSTNVVTSLAGEQLSQGNISAAQQPIETLLDRGALAQAATVLTPALTQQADNPTMNFLMGRLAWQSILAGDKNYSVDDARRYWETAVKKQPNPQYQNALAFAYYTEGNIDRASRIWLQALQPPNQSTTTVSNRQTNGATQDTLTSYAGLSLALMKSAENQPPSKQASLRSEAIKLRQRVLADDPANFQPEALTKNWMWSEQAIQDWRSLMSLK